MTKEGQQRFKSPLSGEEWKAQGVMVALSEYSDDDALEKAFTGVDGVFVIIPRAEISAKLDQLLNLVQNLPKTTE